MKMFKIITISVLIFVFSTAAIGQSPVQFKPYGFFKFDMAYDQARTNNGNYIFWVNNVPDGMDKDNELNVTARQTRLGVNLITEEFENKRVTARFELDFYKGPDENKNYPMLRHAYLKVDFDKFYILAGQTSDVISPLVPATLNYTVLWNSGNPGYRRPQLQVGNQVKEGFQVVGALSRNIAGDLDGDGSDDGEDFGLPTVQARLSYIKPGVLNIGISGHFGRMEFGDDGDYDSTSLVGHFQYTVDKVTFKAEGFIGKTLSQYLSGIGQGYNTALGKEVESRGGWFSMESKVDENINLNIGVGIDNPKKDTLSPGMRDSNLAVYGNVFTTIARGTQLAFELSRWETGYYNGSGSDKTSSIRFQTGFIFKF